MTSSESLCSSCGEPLSRNGVCAACAFGAVLTAEAGDADSSSWLGTTETPQFKLPSKLSLPARFGEYELRREIAAGGMGIVYEAWHARARRAVALKMVRGHELASATELARFKLEAAAAAQLDHPHIVPIHEIGECEGQPFYTMKLIEGVSLAQRLKQEKALPSREAATLMAQVARAVHHAHQRGVLHRDLKPGNILLDAAGTPYLTDFGLARIGDAESGLTLSSAHLGTPHYMSPEQAAGRAREISTASDVWALGVILYQMLSGRLPFPGATGPDVMRRILEQEPPSLSTERGRLVRGAQAEDSPAEEPAGVALDRDLVTIITRCLEKQPARRMSSALTLAEELELWLAGEPIRLRPVTGLERMMKWCRRHPGRVAAVAAVSLSLVGGSLVSLFQWRRAERSAAEARTARDAAAEDAYYSTLANAWHERTRFDFASARQLLAGLGTERRDFVWRLVNNLCQGDDEWAVTVPGGAQPQLLTVDPATGAVWLLAGDRSLHTVDPETGGMKAAGTVPVAQEVRLGARYRGFRQFGFSRDGAHYFVAEGPMLLVVEKASGRLVWWQDCRSAVEAAWLDASRLIFGQSSRYTTPPDTVTAWTWDLRTGAVEDMPKVPIAGPFAVSPDGASVAWVRGMTGGYRIILRGVDAIRSGAPDVSLQEGDGVAVWGMAFSGDSKSLAAVWNTPPHGRLVLYSLPDGKVLETLPVSALSTVACAPDTRHAAVIGQDPWVTLLNPDAGSEHAVYDDGNQGMGTFIDMEAPLRPPVRLLTRSVQSGRAGFLFGHEAPPGSVVFAPGGGAILTAGSDGTVRRWPLRSRIPLTKRLNNIDTSHNWHHPIASPDGSRVACRDVNTKQSFVYRFGEHRRVGFGEDVSCIACFDDGRVLLRHATGHVIICCRMNGETPEKLWETPCGKSIQGFRQIIHSATTPDGNMVGVLMPGKIITVDMQTHAVRETGDQQMEYGLTPGQCIALSPDGRLAAVTGFAGMRARLYQTASPEAGHVKVIPATVPDTYDTACVFTRDGTRLCVGNEDGWVRVFDVSTRRELTGESWKAHTTAVTALAVSHSSGVIATAAEGAIALWSEVLTPGQPRRERLRMSQDRARNWLHFATGDKALLHSAPERPVEVWTAE